MPSRRHNFLQERDFAKILFVAGTRNLEVSFLVGARQKSLRISRNILSLSPAYEFSI